MKTLTVVTVCYNAAATIEATIQSVVGQTAIGEVEYLIIDGASTDNTVAIASRYSKRIDRIVSEKDFGIYDAMNKAAQLASTPWILFMNAGDLFPDNSTLASLHLADQEPDHVIYGDCTRVWPDGRLEPRTARPFFNHLVRRPDGNIKARAVTSIGICHQSIYMPTAILRQHPFCWQEYPRCADFKLCYDLWTHGIRFDYIPQSLCLYAYGDGFSSDRKFSKLVFDENARILGLTHTFTYYKQRLRMMLGI